jgi:hypothetical protein
MLSPPLGESIVSVEFWPNINEPNSNKAVKVMKNLPAFLK